MLDDYLSSVEKRRLSATLGNGDPDRIASEALDGDRPVCIYGSGFAGEECLALFSSVTGAGERVLAFLDGNTDKQGRVLENRPILRPDDARVTAANPIVILASYIPTYLEEMAGQCRRLGYDAVHSGVLYFRAEHAKAIRRAADVWADADSKRVYRYALRHILTRDAGELTSVAEPNQYFPPFMPARQYASFVDGGAYFGDTLSAYRTMTGGDFDNYYAFEPDARNFTRLERETRGDVRIHLYPKALFNCETNMPFLQCSHAGGSHVGEGGDAVACATIDAELAGNPVTYIKMDVEGAEPAALEGAEQIIRTRRPGLGICVYHHPSHLWDIPLWIKRVEPGYGLYLRHHSAMSGCETVCYAVP